MHKYFKQIIGYFIALLGVYLLTPQTYLLSPYKIPPNEVRILLSNVNTLPYRLVHMPSDVRMNEQYRPRQTKARQYHFQFDEAWPVLGPRSIFMPSTGRETRLYVNGAPIANDTNKALFAPGLGKGWVYQDVRRQFLLPGRNRLDVYVNADEARAGVRGIYFGPTNKVKRVVRQYEIWTQVMPRMASLAGALVIILSILGLVYSKKGRTYLILGCLGCLVLSLGSMSLFIENPVLKSFDLVFRFVLPSLILMMLALLWRSESRNWRGEKYGGMAAYRAIFYALAVTGPLVSLAVLTLPFSIPAPVFFATLALVGPLPLLFACVVPMLLSDLKAHSSKLEQLKIKLSEQTEELDEKGQALNQEIRNRAILEERQRFTRDIHDGIGGQLLSLLLRVRSGKLNSGEIATEIQGGLNDLRLVVDSMDHTGDNLTAALTTFHSRANAQMTAAGIDLKWEQSDHINIQFRSTRAILHVYRFLQESLSNIIKHAQAKNVAISLLQEGLDEPFVIRIKDDGIGLKDDSENSAGKGLENLKLRAQRLGGSMEFTKGLSGKGTGVELTIPLLAQLD